MPRELDSRAQPDRARARGRNVCPRKAGRGGFSLLEVVLALTIALIGLLGLVAAATAGAKLQEQTQQYGSACRAIQRVHERLRSGEIDERIAEIKAAPTFEDGTVTVNVTFPAQVFADTLGRAIPAGWRYRDLDDDGEVDLDAAATTTATLVPVQVVATWGGGSLRSCFLVTDR